MHSITKRALDEGRPLFENEARDILKLYGIDMPPHQVAHNEDEAFELAREMGYPVVMKIVSRDILHKSDAGGVILNISNGAKARSAYAALIKNAKEYDPDARIEGVLVTPMVEQGVEVIIGMTKDPQFGSVIMFGLGGIFVEVFKDVSFRITPLEKLDACEMIESIRSYPILTGIRGESPRDVESLCGLILKVSELCEELPELTELDLNPVFVYEKGYAIVDARMLV